MTSEFSLNSQESIMPTKDASDFRFHRLERDQQYTDLQFRQKEPPIPVKQILIASVMFICGSIMIIMGALLMSGHIDAKYGDRMWPLFIVGTLLFLPGFYHVRIAWYAWRKYDGFSFEEFPSDD